MRDIRLFPPEKGLGLERLEPTGAGLGIVSGCAAGEVIALGSQSTI